MVLRGLCLLGSVTGKKMTREDGPPPPRYAEQPATFLNDSILFRDFSPTSLSRPLPSLSCICTDTSNPNSSELNAFFPPQTSPPSVGGACPVPKLETRKARQVSSLSCCFKYNRAPRPAGHTYSLQRLVSPMTPASSFLNDRSKSYLALLLPAASV